jgi:hypothetical protein
MERTRLSCKDSRMQIQCSKCGDVVPATDVNLDRMLAKCSRCNDVFDIRAHVPGSSAMERRRPQLARPNALRIVEDERAPLPGTETYRIEATPRPRLLLERRWFQPRLLIMALFCIAWGSFMSFRLSTAIRHGGPWWFMILHVAFGIGVTYSTLCGLVNRTRIAIAGGRLVIQHGPLPWRGNRDLDTQDLNQLFCEEKIGNRGARSYALSARTRSGQTIALLTSLPDAQQALYLEQLLEDRLGIVDAPITGELKS